MTAEAPMTLTLPAAGARPPSAPPAERAAPGRTRHGLGRNRARAGILLSLPALVLVLFVLIVPIGEAIYYSMTNWNGLTAQWVGPSTYTTLFKDPVFWRVLENNGILLLAVPVALGVPLGIAALLHEHVWLWKLFRSLIFLPTAVSWVVIGMIAVRLFAPGGTVNYLLGLFGLARFQTDFLGHEYTAILAVALTFVWSMIGTNTIIFLTGMSTVDPAIYEAARLDGAGRWAAFRRITVPMLKRYFQFTFVITMITAFTALFSLIFIMTGGGPGYGTTTLEFFVYQQAFDVGQFGTGAMLGVVLFVLLFGVSLVQLRLLREDR
ncbi:MAG: sugar ABC transporter permease [Actinomycetota bacterium]|nr:sugar ABC transporter permease [Actinomycetota bacterium]